MVFLVIVTSWAWAPLENIFVTITSPLLWISPAFYLFLIITAQSRKKTFRRQVITWQPIKESDYVPAWCRLCSTKPYTQCTCSSDFFKSSTKWRNTVPQTFHSFDVAVFGKQDLSTAGSQQPICVSDCQISFEQQSTLWGNGGALCN